ncbi:PilZ domain-containing protein [Marinobacter zhejiangensis]|uniref:Cyclic diguanosine monophosphate-binding protein n=1 Tax=Marinobacter zhejiangensis TaxID=488535 RepID=A0A1I4S9F4_9GAMM|nr:PilZ domain-containing protein [Marinobacter zhejiangensis]SFM61112.1 PilZ domain-containing protein [Marinobacter zhejiangensis]
MSHPSSEKRRFHRILFDAPCDIHWQDAVWSTEVLDISLKGLLVKLPQEWNVPLNEPCEVVIHLDGHGAAIVMAVALRHVEGEKLGFKCQYIDLDSATHLRRLVELNLGEPALLERELNHLIES